MLRTIYRNGSYLGRHRPMRTLGERYSSLYLHDTIPPVSLQGAMFSKFLPPFWCSHPKIYFSPEKGLTAQKNRDMLDLLGRSSDRLFLLCESIAKNRMRHFLTPSGQPKMMRKNFMRYGCCLLSWCAILRMKFYSFLGASGAGFFVSGLSWMVMVMQVPGSLSMEKVRRWPYISWNRR